MSEFISKLSLDIANNGKVDDVSLTAKIKDSSQDVNSTGVIRNLEQRYSELGLSIEIDNFYDFIDSNGDGVLNGESPYLHIDDTYRIFDHKISKQSIYFSANYTPEINIVSDDNFVKIISIDESKVVIELLENTGRQKAALLSCNLSLQMVMWLSS